ncbi:MAG: TOTE conflict system archaeo-eukaryotic primase domain-containing protein [Bacteroidota bacterium]
MGSHDNDPLAILQAENARLITLLESHGIDWRPTASEPESPATIQAEPLQLSTNEKVKLFRRLFQGRSDVYPIRWESKTTGKSGYSPACANEWRTGICHKPRIKCGDCEHRLLEPLSDSIIYDHLAGEHTIGVYPLLPDDTCLFLAVDFDEQEWRDDARAFIRSCKELGLPAALEISRSGSGAHAWIFFSRRVAARDARRLGSAVISHTCAQTRQLKLASYDRLFPNQDSMPKGGFGNLIALPLQKKPREEGKSVFVDERLAPFADQWAYLASIKSMEPADLEAIVFRATGGAHPLDVTFIDEEDNAEPWKKRTTTSGKLAGVMPASIKVTSANLLYVEKEGIPQSLANRLIRLAAFQNPEFYKAQAMRLPVWDKPRVIGCAENFPKHIGLPRGCMDALSELAKANSIRLDVIDERFPGNPIEVSFQGKLRLDQEAAIAAMLHHETGVLCAPTAFGKTVTAAAVIARRKTNTLILVHRTELLKQWQERLQSYLGVGKEVVGTIGGGKPKPTGIIDIAVMQSLSRKGEINQVVENYGQVIIDECHHVSSLSFESLLKSVKAKFVLGLTATPIRRDGLQAIIFMQCGPIRHVAEKPAGAPQKLEVRAMSVFNRLDLAPDTGIQEIFKQISSNYVRTQMIADAALAAFREGRKILVLTERTEHLDAISQILTPEVPELMLLHGRMSKKQRSVLTQQLDALPPDAPRILLATGKLVGEGFDHPPLDTLLLAMPVSWKGTLQQYAGRLHREHADKSDVRIVDFIDADQPALMRMWEKRQRGYRVMGYQILNG